MRHLKQQKIRTPYAARVCICIGITSTFHTHPLEPQGFEGCFPCFGRGGFPCFFPYWNLQAGNRLNLLFHPVSAGLFHLGGDMSVNVQRKGGGSVSQVFLHRLNVIPGLNCHNRICMPLWHNKDKSENPCNARS